LLLGGEAREELLVLQALELARERLDRVLDAEDAVLRPPLLLGAERGVAEERLVALAQHLERERQRGVSLELELARRLEAIGVAGMAEHEHELAVLGSGLVPFEPVRRARGLAVLVDAEEREVEVEARVREVVGVAAVE